MTFPSLEELDAKMRQSSQEESLLRYLRDQIQQEESELRHSALRRSVSLAASSLASNPKWTDLQKLLREQEEQTLNALRTVVDPTPAVVARLQAYLRALRLMTLEPMATEDLARLEQEDRMRLQKLAELRELLPTQR